MIYIKRAKFKRLPGWRARADKHAFAMVIALRYQWARAAAVSRLHTTTYTGTRICRVVLYLHLARSAPYVFSLSRTPTMSATFFVKSVPVLRHILLKPKTSRRSTPRWYVFSVSTMQNR